MTTPARRVHRLLDMVVEEVSLVDRAANNRRFLLVKRDDPMTKTKGALTARQKAREGATRKRDTSDAAPAATSPAPAPPAPPAATAPAPAGSPPAEGAPPPDGVDKQAAGPLGVALSALESLTEAVELLSTVADGEGAADLPTLAGELREAADALAGAAGYEPSSDEGEAGDEGSAEAEGAGDVNAVITAVRSTLADVQALLAGAADDAGATPADKAAGDGGLGAVATALKALTAAVAAQGERLVALEKRAGVPQSRSPEAPPRPAAPAEVSWPLDLNRPLDRASVDRTVSFHDP
ncbi:MAG TPA: hypothetical protein VFS43_46535 [Polyangiaceae bacterium]|nr:hypothetical protein [Polyangiaceae bacterium]